MPGLRQRLFSTLLLGVLVNLAGCASSGSEQTSESFEYSAEQAALSNVDASLGYLQRGRKRVALEFAQRARQHAEHLPQVQHALALVYAEMGDADAARKHYHAALNLAPDDPIIENAYATFLCAQGRFDKADQYFRKAAHNVHYSTPEVAYANAGVCAAKASNPAQAEAYFLEATKTNARHAPAWLELAELQLGQGRKRQARLSLQRLEAVQLSSPASAWLGYRIGQALADNNTMKRYGTMLRTQFPQSAQTRLLENDQ